MLTNVTLYWLTRTAGPSAQIYYENMHSMSGAPPERSPVPTAVANFAEDIAIRRFAEPAHTIARWTDFDRGGHSPPWRRRTCWSATSASFSGASADPPTCSDVGRQPR